MLGRLDSFIGRGVVDVRGLGLWAGVDIDPRLGTGRAVSQALARRGVLVQETRDTTVRLSPALVTCEAELTLALDTLADVVLFRRPRTV